MKPLNTKNTESIDESNKSKSNVDNKITEPIKSTQTQVNYNQMQPSQYIPYVDANKNVSYMPVQKPM